MRRPVILSNGEDCLPSHGHATCPREMPALSALRLRQDLLPARGVEEVVYRLWNKRSSGRCRRQDWHLIKAGAPAIARAQVRAPALGDWGDLEERELALGIEPRRPFLLRPDFTPDIDVLLYFASPRFRLLAPQSQLGYANNHPGVSSPTCESQGVDWREATEDHLLNYEYRRRRKPIENQSSISGAAFARELAALNHFFSWQKDRGVIQESPIKLRSYRRHDGTTGTTPSQRPKNVRSWDVKWLVPDIYRDWRRVGLGGYTAEGLPDPSWRGRNDARNLAFADALWTTGLRRREAGTLLQCELPPPRHDGWLSRARVAGAVAKGGARNFRISQVGLRAIDGYRDSTRALAVLRAQAAGRYDHVQGRKIVRHVTARRQLRLENQHGNITTESLDALHEDDRQTAVHRRHPRARACDALAVRDGHADAL